jgi:Fe-S cluster biogenesis protein NfuA
MTAEYSFSWGEGAEALRLTASPSPYFPDTCRFTLNRNIYPDSAVHFASLSASKGSPLAENLFGLKDIDQVLIANDVITVVVKNPKEWDTFSPQVASVIHETIENGSLLIDPKIKETLPPPEQIRSRVADILDSDINPSIASHGGFVKLVDIKGNNVYLQFGGGCQGCGMANITLKYGVERHLRSRIPELGEVLDITDHQVGQRPYYS